MTHDHNDNHKALILDAVDHPIVSDSDAPAVTIHQLPRGRWSWVDREKCDGTFDSAPHWWVERA